MKIIYLGADVPSNRTILETMGMQDVGVSFWRLKQRGLPKTKPYLLDNYFSPFMKVHVHAGLPRVAQLTRKELDEFAGEYEDFIANNLDRLDTFMELDHAMLSTEDIENQREHAWYEPEPFAKFLPVWRPTDSFGYISELAGVVPNIAVPYELLEDDTTMAAKVRNLQNAHGTHFHAIGCAKPDNLRQVPVESASTLSWLSPMMRGETIVWDGRRLVRYPKKMKDQSRPRYRQVYENAGLDVDKIMDDDAVEVCKLALWSYEQFEEWFNMTTHNEGADRSELYDNSDNTEVEPKAETTPSVPDKRGTGMRKLEQRNPSEKHVLPVFGVTYTESVESDAQGNDVVSDIPTITSSHSSLRQCNTCFVAANCPAFKANNECAFSLPVELKTKEQLKSLITAILEMQGQRVAFARFSEEINGGYPDPNVSQEIDRMFKILKAVKDLESSREFVQITAERQGGAGVLSAIFGDKAQGLTQLPNNGYTEEQTTRIIQQAIED